MGATAIMVGRREWSTKAAAGKRSKRSERPFHAGKAGPSIKRLAEYLDKWSLHEKVIAVLYADLVSDGDLASALQESGAYRGDITDDLSDTWWEDVATGTLDADDAYALELLRALQH